MEKVKSSKLPKLEKTELSQRRYPWLSSTRVEFYQSPGNGGYFIELCEAPGSFVRSTFYALTSDEYAKFEALEYSAAHDSGFAYKALELFSELIDWEREKREYEK